MKKRRSKKKIADALRTKDTHTHLSKSDERTIVTKSDEDFRALINDYLMQNPDTDTTVKFLRCVLRETGKRLDLKIMRKIFFDVVNVPKPPPLPGIERRYKSSPEEQNLLDQIVEKRNSLAKVEAPKVKPVPIDSLSLAMIRHKRGELLKKAPTIEKKKTDMEKCIDMVRDIKKNLRKTKVNEHKKEVKEENEKGCTIC